MKVRTHHSNTPHQKHSMSQSVMNAGESQWASSSFQFNGGWHPAYWCITTPFWESQWAFDYPAVKPVVWSGNIQSAHAFLFTVTGLAAQDGDEDRRIKAWIWVCSSQSYGFGRFGLQHTNKIVSFRNCVVFLVYFIVILSVTACRRKCLLWPMANKVNITWQVKVKRLQKSYLF